MNRWLAPILAIPFMFLAAAGGAGTEAAETSSEKPLAVLLTFGGHGFEEAPFFAMFDAMQGITYTKAPLPESAHLLKPGLEKKYDVIVMYDMVPGFQPQQQRALVELLQRGIGVVSLHHNLGAHQEWDEFHKIIGGKFCTKPCKIEGISYATSGWSHDEDLSVTIVDKTHPITRGLEDFQIHDETYQNYYTAKDVTVLLKTDHPKNDPELAWVKNYGRSRVFYFMLGHNSKAWANPNFVKILTQGIRWAARR